MKQFLFTISSLIIVTSLFIACSNDMDDYCTKTDQCIYTEYIELSTNMSPDVKLKNLKEAEQRILDNIRIIDGKISLSHISDEELLINPEYFEAMKFLLENCDDAYEIITPRTRSTTLSSGENEQNDYFTQKDELAYIITSLLDSDLEKKLFLNYWYAKGDIVLTDSEWSGIKQYAETINNQFYSEVTGVEISFYSNENYDSALGTATIFFLKNEAIGLTDTYDFNPMEFGKREFTAELLTRYMDILGSIYDAKEFKIEYSSL